MRPTGSLLLLLSATALGGEMDVVEIANVMAAREAATYPLAARYRARAAGHELYDARYAADRGEGRALWRGSVGVPNARGGVSHEDRLWTRYDGAWLYAWHEPDRVLTEWRGFLAREREFDWPELPVDYGLEQASEPVSSFLRRRSARIVGRERVGRFECIRVLVDWVHSDQHAIQHPLGLWLAGEHDYYPVRTAVYALASGSGLLPADRLHLDGRVFLPRELREVDALMAIGHARLPLRAHRVPRAPGERRVDIELVEGSVRVGAGDAAFDLPPFLYLHDRRHSGYLWLTPLGAVRISFLWIALYIVGAAGLGYAVRALRRRWRRRDPDELRWEEPSRLRRA